MVTLPTFYVIRLWILYYALPESVLLWEVCYIYFLFISDYSNTTKFYPILYWYFWVSYNGVFIDIFVYVIQSNCRLYLILDFFLYIYPMFGLLFQCIVVILIFVLIFFVMLYICLLWYVGVIHTICSLVVPHIGNIVIHISCIWFIMKL